MTISPAKAERANRMLMELPDLDTLARGNTLLANVDWDPDFFGSLKEFPGPCGVGWLVDAGASHLTIRYHENEWVLSRRILDGVIAFGRHLERQLLGTASRGVIGEGFSIATSEPMYSLRDWLPVRSSERSRFCRVERSKYPQTWPVIASRPQMPASLLRIETGGRVYYIPPGGITVTSMGGVGPVHVDNLGWLRNQQTGEFEFRIRFYGNVVITHPCNCVVDVGDAAIWSKS